MRDAFLHFLRGFVGKSHGQNAIRWRSMPDQVCNSKRDNTSLAGSSPCENEKRSRKRVNRMLLWGIQFCHGCNLQSLCHNESPIH
jgi:hypothetical protein